MLYGIFSVLEISNATGTSCQRLFSRERPRMSTISTSICMID